MALGDWRVNLIYAKSIVGDERIIAAPDGVKDVTVGGPTDNWSADLSPTEVNDDTFGVRLYLEAAGEYNAALDAIEVTIYTTSGLGEPSKRVAVLKRADLVEVSPGRFQVRAGAKITISEVE